MTDIEQQFTDKFNLPMGFANKEDSWQVYRDVLKLKMYEDGNTYAAIARYLKYTDAKAVRVAIQKTRDRLFTNYGNYREVYEVWNKE